MRAVGPGLLRGTRQIQPERIREILADVWGEDAGQADRLATACLDVLSVAGASATVVVAGGPPELLCCSGAIAGRIQHLQYTLGEGPGLDADQTGLPVGEADLASPRRVRWPMLAEGAGTTGAAALFAFPLRVGGVRLGALTLNQPRAGGLSDAQHTDAAGMADVALQVALALRAGAPPGPLPVGLEALGDGRAEVSRAAGMVSVQLSVDVAEALVRLGARSLREGRPLPELAADVVARRVRFEA